MNKVIFLFLVSTALFSFFTAKAADEPNWKLVSPPEFNLAKPIFMNFIQNKYVAVGTPKNADDSGMYWSEPNTNAWHAVPFFTGISLTNVRNSGNQVIVYADNLFECKPADLYISRGDSIFDYSKVTLSGIPDLSQKFIIGMTKASGCWKLTIRGGAAYEDCGLN